MVNLCSGDKILIDSYIY